MATLSEIFTNIATAIRSKGSTTDKITASNMSTAVNNIVTTKTNTVNKTNGTGNIDCKFLATSLGIVNYHKFGLELNIIGSNLSFDANENYCLIPYGLFLNVIDKKSFTASTKTVSYSNSLFEYALFLDNLLYITGTMVSYQSATVRDITPYAINTNTLTQTNGTTFTTHGYLNVGMAIPDKYANTPSYCLFGYGNDTYGVILYINKNLSMGLVKESTQSLPLNESGWTNVGNYVIIAGGASGAVKSDVMSISDKLSISYITSLSEARYCLSETRDCLKNYGIIAGGSRPTNIFFKTVDAYNTDLTRFLPWPINITSSYTPYRFIKFLNLKYFIVASSSNSYYDQSLFDNSLTRTDYSISCSYNDTDLVGKYSIDPNIYFTIDDNYYVYSKKDNGKYLFNEYKVQ